MLAVEKTHRGVLITPDLIKGGETIFGVTIPAEKLDGNYYSL